MYGFKPKSARGKTVPQLADGENVKPRGFKAIGRAEALDFLGPRSVGLIWGVGDGSTMQAVDTPYGRVGAVICWENYMPMLRMHMYSQGVSIYCAPTADDRDTWLPTMRHIALEGRCFVLTACQFLRREAYPKDFECSLGDDPQTVLLRGGSAIIDPTGAIMTGPNYEDETILYADIDPIMVPRGKFDFDASGHYSRPDIFQLKVDVGAKKAVSTVGGAPD